MSEEQLQALFDKNYNVLKDAIQQGTGARIEKLKYNQTDFEMTKQLTQNVGVFAAFKSHAYMNEVVQQLTNEQGELVNFATFREKALQISQKYNQQWLATEYETAVRTARYARDWQGIERTKHLYPNLEYIISRSTVKRKEHLDLEGTILPIDDPFWDKYYPPNGWGCKCSVRKTDKPVQQPEALPALAPEFSFNAGKQGKIFSVEDSGYAKMLKPNVREKVLQGASRATFEVEKADFATVAESSIINKQFDIGSRKVAVKSIESLMNYSDRFMEKFAVVRNLASITKQGKWAAPQYYEYKVGANTVRIEVEQINDELRLKNINIYE